jgi:hypothetical protein
MVYQNNAKFYADFKTAGENGIICQQESYRQNNCAKLEFVLTCKTFWQITFPGCTFFQLFQRIWNWHKILRIFDIHIQNKNKNLGGVIEYLVPVHTCMSIFWM